MGGRIPGLQETEEQLKLLQSEQAQFVTQYQELTRLQSSKDGGGSSADARKRSDSTRSRADHLERQLSDGPLGWRSRCSHQGCGAWWAADDERG